MTITQTVTPFPEPVPSRQDPDSFSSRADATMGHLGVFVSEINIVIDQANTFMTATSNDAADSARRAADSESAAAISATAAESAKQSAQIAAVSAGYQGDYSSLTTYSKSQTVTYGGMLFISKINGNLNNTPQDGASWAMLGLGRIMIMRHL